MTTRFVILASMRTGSNLLNSHLNQYRGVLCHGEAFNPSFIGVEQVYLTQLGLERNDIEKRNADTRAFLERLTAFEAEIIGFHLFPGHAPDILQQVLATSNYRKICLRRSLFHSFASLQIAKRTDVWRVTKRGPRAEISLQDKQFVFDPDEFERYRKKLDDFWAEIFKILRNTGQQHFSIWYSGLNQVKIINALIEFLGGNERKMMLPEIIEKQNPESLKDIVINWEQMIDYARSKKLEHTI